MLIADQPSPHTTSATGHRRYWGFRGIGEVYLAEASEVVTARRGLKA